MNPAICRIDKQVVFFPVRHHSPQAALKVTRLIGLLEPAAVLIEGPHDYNPYLAELDLPHRLPIAIYSYAHLADGRRAGAFYPFCVYSPEWQALKAARGLGAEVLFIDMPWAQLAARARVRNRYADRFMSESNYIKDLCVNVGVDDFDSLWDTISEIDEKLDLHEYLERCHNLCYCMRLSDGAGVEDIEREEFMARQITEAGARHPGRSVLVVTGGFHSYALWARLFGGDGEKKLFENPARGLQVPEEQNDQEAVVFADRDQVVPKNAVTGICLTPYSYERLDRLSGYEAGMPGPGFYHQVFEDQLAQEPDSWRKLLYSAVADLRKRRQSLSCADVIAVETTAQALASLRAHSRVWRQDLIDGIVGGLVKDEMVKGVAHPLLDAVNLVLRGEDVGKLAPGSRLPFLVHDIENLIETYDLRPSKDGRNIELDLSLANDRQRSCVAHRIRCLEIPGFYLEEDVAFVATREDGRIIEHWRLEWSPEFDAACIEASIFGATLEDAVSRRLSERAAQIGVQAEAGDSKLAALLVVEASLMGLTELSAELWKILIELISHETDAYRLAEALGFMLYLHHYDKTLATKPHLEIADLVARIFDRCLWLLDSQGAFTESQEKVVEVMRLLLDAYERCRDLVKTSEEYFIQVLTRIRQDGRRNPMLRGASAGILWTLAKADEQMILADLTLFSQAEQMGDFLTGLFSLAREVVRYRNELLRKIDELLMVFDTDEYLAALPRLRMAFSVFSPGEKFHMTQQLFASRDEDQAGMPDMEVGAAAMALEERIRQALLKHGLRGAPDEY